MNIKHQIFNEVWFFYLFIFLTTHSHEQYVTQGQFLSGV